MHGHGSKTLQLRLRRASGRFQPTQPIGTPRFKKTGNNAQGAQSRGNVAGPVNPSDPRTASGPRGGVPNGAHVQQQYHELPKICCDG